MKVRSAFRHSIVFFILLVAFVVLTSGVWASGEKPGIRTIFLVRHGEYDLRDPRSPYIGRGLVPLGIAQARLVAARLRAYPFRFDSLYSSTMTRAYETALVINQYLPYLRLKRSPLISECTPPSRHLRRLDPIRAEQCRQRLEAAFKKLFVPSPAGDRHDIIVCHGNVIRYFVTRVLGVDPSSWINMSIYNCSLTVVRIYPNRRMKLVSYNDIGHIPPNMQTEPGPEEFRKFLVLPRPSSR